MSEFIVNNLFDGFILLALPLAILAGVISFISPCVLPLVPGYVAFAAGYSQSRGRVLLGSLLFVSGFSALFISYGALFGGFGARIAANEEMITHLLGFFTIVLGLIFAGVYPMMPTIRPKLSTTGGLIGAPVLGFLFGVGWTPCIGPALATVQTLAFTEASAFRGALLSLGYCFGLGLPFIATGLFLDKSEKLRKFLTHNGRVISLIGGALLILSSEYFK
jgi:cytochrome c-type biogenesis protein